MSSGWIVGEREGFVAAVPLLGGISTARLTPIFGCSEEVLMLAPPEFTPMSEGAPTTDGTTEVSDEEILSVFENMRGPVVTSKDVAVTVGMSTESARERLYDLYERGLVDKRKASNVIVWWRKSDEGSVDVPEIYDI